MTNAKISDQAAKAAPEGTDYGVLEDGAGNTYKFLLANQFYGAPAAGDMVYFDGTNWIKLNKPASGIARLRNDSGNPYWENFLSAKAADQTLTQSNTTLQDLTSLAFAVAANKMYWFRAYPVVSAANTTADIKFGFTYPTGATMRWGGIQAFYGTSAPGFSITGENAAAVIALWIETTVAPHPTINGVGGVGFQGFVYNGANAGTVQLQAAQNTSNASDVKILAGSFVEWMKLN